MSLQTNLVEMERAREQYWQRYPGTSSRKLRWRALTVRHCFHVLPGESILELGAGSGFWTEHLAQVLRYENPITAAVFNDNLAAHPRWQSLKNVSCARLDSLDSLPAESFDYIVGTAILCHDQYQNNLMSLYRLLKPGGQLLFFESNFWNPQVFFKSTIRWIGRWCGNAACQVGLRRYRLLQIASQAGFSHLDIIPYDIVHPRIPKRLVQLVQSLAFVFEHMPVVKETCGTLYIRARRPGASECRRAVSLTEHRELSRAVSFVIPCYNEESNVARLVDALIRFYDDYIHEIIIVNDNSTDRTAAVTREIAIREPRLKLLNRQSPNGVGRALRDGYAFATGTYIFSIDADFVHIIPEFRDLFDAVVSGSEGAVGSRFTHESVMVNYPFFKILCNRAFHLMANLALPIHVHDISNNLKLYRADVLKDMEISQPHFAANAEIGLKAIVAGYRVREVPVSWINRTIDMGSSSFRIASVAPNYFGALVDVVRRSREIARKSTRGAALVKQTRAQSPAARE